ncbi:glycerol kinase [Limosa lapponica baueri]|uniref:Glycerol kinase n=1 Tax=Limosa lapponica baueri TaxID=1758121 RepID=A0A2I0UF83_LIMLA|nr:glycerol kinase [Limosa lapponica baueri]
MGNKQEELEATVLLESYDIVANTETWCDESHDWSVAIEGYKLFRRDRRERRGGGVTLYVKEWIESEEISIKPSLVSVERVESLWVTVKGQTNMRYTVVGVYYRPPDQDGEVHEVFYNQLQVASQLQALVLVVLGSWFLNHPDICWKVYTDRNTQSRRFLQCVDDNFLTQLVEEPMRREALLDLVLTNKEGPVEDSKVEGNLGCSDHGKIEFRIVGSIYKTSRTETLDCKRPNFVLFKKLLGEIPWARALEGKGAQESWAIFKHCFLQAQDQCIRKSKKSGKGSRRPVWLSRELLKKLKRKKEVYTEWKKGLTTWEDYKDTVRLCREETRKAKASLELKLARDVKVNKKGFFNYI